MFARPTTKAPYEMDRTPLLRDPPRGEGRPTHATVSATNLIFELEDRCTADHQTRWTAYV